MGMHTKSDRLKRKMKYAEQFKKTADNKKRRALKRERKLKEKKEGIS